MAEIHLALAVGTRPEAIKLAPVIAAIDHHPEFCRTVITTGQHQDLVRSVLRGFDLQPDVQLEVDRSAADLHELTAGVIAQMAPVLGCVAPDAVIVQGDTTSAMATALTAAHHQIPVVHVEAGLRTGDRTNPFPEEANRRLIAVLCDLHLAPTARARAALLAEGVRERDIVVTGNTVIDAMLATAASPTFGLDHAAVADLLDGRPLLLVTLHRRESWDSELHEIASAVATIAERHRDLSVVLPLHPNPLVQEVLLPALGIHPNVRVTAPLSYPTFVRTLAASSVVLTDSGGVQEEAPSFGVPVLVARLHTERSEAVDAGVAKLIGLTHDDVVKEIDDALDLIGERDVEKLTRNPRPSPFGDGHAAKRVVEALAWRLIPDRRRPSDFVS